MGYALRGYDPIIADEFMGTSDPGLRSQIFVPTFVDDKDGRVRVHDNIDWFDSLHCTKKAQMSSVESYTDYREQAIGNFEMEENLNSQSSFNVPLISVLIGFSSTKSQSKFSSSSSEF